MLAKSSVALLVFVVVAGWAMRRWRTPASQSLDREAMEVRRLPDTSNVDEVAISPDGRYVVYARRIGEKVSLRMRQIESGGDVEVLPAAEVDFVESLFLPMVATSISRAPTKKTPATGTVCNALLGWTVPKVDH